MTLIDKLRSSVLARLLLLVVLVLLMLQIQDYALLVGAVGCFLVVALVMFLTRRVDWYTAGGGTP